MKGSKVRYEFDWIDWRITLPHEIYLLYIKYVSHRWWILKDMLKNNLYLTIQEMRVRKKLVQPSTVVV